MTRWARSLADRRRLPALLLVGGLALLGGSQPAAARAAPAQVALATPAAGDISIEEASTLLSEHDYARAVAVLGELSRRGDVKAQTMLAGLLAYGPAEIRDPAAGFRAAGSAADAGYPSAQTVLGFFYLSGVGTSRDDDKALELFRKAATQKDAGAEQELGSLYAAGKLVPKDAAQSVKWTADAAEQGNGLALYSIATDFGEGTVLPKDPRQAFFWYSAALPRLGDNQIATNAAIRGRDKAAAELSFDQVRPLQMLAQLWVPAKNSLDGVRAQAGKSIIGPTPLASGSGFVVDGAGAVLTAWHVVKACKRVSVALPGGAPIEAALGARDEKADLALLRPATPLGQPVTLRDRKSLRQGETVLAAGYPISDLLGADLSTTVGTVSSVGGWRWNKQGLLFSASVSPGNSGGPLIDEDGAVVGLVEGQLDNLALASFAGIIAENVNFASGLQAIRSFLDANKIAYLRGAPAVPLGAVELSERARGFTLFVSCEG